MEAGLTEIPCIEMDVDVAFKADYVEIEAQAELVNEPLRAKLAEESQRRTLLKPNDPTAREVTVLADKGLPYSVLKKIMSTATAADIGRLSLAVVEKERELDHDSVVAFADGRVFTGEQAKRMALVDTLGTYEDAITMTADLAKIKGKPALVKERKRGPSLFDRVFGDTKFNELFELKDELLNQPLLQYRMAQGF